MVWVILVIAGILLILALFVLNRSRRPRQAGFVGIEDEAVMQGYDCLSRWPQFKLLRMIAIRKLKTLQPQGTLTDLGCGPGYLLIKIAQTFPHLSLVGLDIAQAATDKARQNMAERGFASRVEFRSGDIEQLPFAEHSLDFVVSTLSLHHWLKPDIALQEIRRVLKKDGKFLIFDVRRDAPLAFYMLIRFAQAFIIPRAIAHINEPTVSFNSAYTPSEVETLLSGTSFRDWQVETGPFWIFLTGSK